MKAEHKVSDAALAVLKTKYEEKKNKDAIINCVANHNVCYICGKKLWQKYLHYNRCSRWICSEHGIILERRLCVVAGAFSYTFKWELDE